MWVTRMTKSEAEYFAKQPTAQKMQEKMLKDGTYIPEGDKEAAAAFVAQRDAEKAARAASGSGGASDVVELSSEGKSLQASTKKTTTDASADASDAATASSDVQFLGEGASRRLRFTSAEAVHQALKDGYVELNGQQYFLSDDMKRTLTAEDKAMQKMRQGIINANLMQQEAVSTRRTGESAQKSAQAQSRIMETAMRIMKGRKVSQADEKELAQAAPDLYKIAKSMGALNQHKLTRKEKEDDDKLSQQHDADREWEQSPSSIPDAVDKPVPEYSVDIEMPDSGSVDIEA